MSDLVQILYNHADAFAPQPTPFIALDYEPIYVGEYWGRAETMTLQGQLTGCTFSDIVAAQRAILASFNKSFQSLEIWQTQAGVSGKIYQKDLVEVRSISFPQDRMVGVLPYSINLYCYPSGLFSGAYGILEPVDTWSFTERENEVLDATHSISCRPFNTSSGPTNAIDNARGWAFGRTGMGSMPTPIFISGVNTNYFCLLSQTENIDRFNGTYSYTENWTNDLARTGYGVIRYTTNVESGNNTITVSLNGNAQGCGRNITGLRYEFGRLDKLAIATKAYQAVFQMTDLNPTPIDQVINEDPFLTNIDFSYVYDNSNMPRTFFDYTVDCEVGTNGTVTAAIQGTVQHRAGNLIDKIRDTQTYADSLNLYALVLPFYAPFDVNSFVPLNPIPTISGRNINYTNGTVGLNASFNNQTKVSAVLDQFNYSMSFGPQVRKIDSRPKLDGTGSYSVVDLGFTNRAGFSVNGSAVTNQSYIPSQGVAAVRQACYNLFQQYGRVSNTVLEQDQISTNRADDRLLSFSFAWSFDGPNTIGPQTIPTFAL